MQLRHAADTDNGRTRDHNEDTYAIQVQPDPPAAGALFVVCDGMGGYEAGEVAAELAADTIHDVYYTAADADPGDALREAFVEANLRVFDQGKGKMGTTGVAAVFLADHVLLANVGDSRAYLISNGRIEQLTHDHSFVAEQVLAGVITEDQARESSYRNIITRALGHRPEVEVDIYKDTVGPGDRLLLCSDGLHGQVEPDEIAEIAGAAPLTEAVEELITLANERGGPDNITAVLVEVVAVDQPSGGRTPPTPVAPARTERLPTTAPSSSTQTARMTPVAAQGTAANVALSRPVQLRQNVAPPLAAPSGRRGPILGMILMTLAGLALLGAVVWFGMSSGFGLQAPTAIPVVPSLTPLQARPTTSSTAGAATPTFVPTPSTAPTAGP